jgi:hypothetical protein
LQYIFGEEVHFFGDFPAVPTVADRFVRVAIHMTCDKPVTDGTTSIDAGKAQAAIGEGE